MLSPDFGEELNRRLPQSNFQNRHHNQEFEQRVENAHESNLTVFWSVWTLEIGAQVKEEHERECEAKQKGGIPKEKAEERYINSGKHGDVNGKSVRKNCSDEE